MIEYKEVTLATRTGKGYEKVVLEEEGIWYQLDGNFHREDGPSQIYENGYQAWLIHGKYHREDGPARILSFPEGHKEYWLNGTPVAVGTYHLFSPLELAKLGLI